MWLRFTLILPIMMKNMISAKWTLFAAAAAYAVAAAAAPGAKPEPRTSETTVSVADFGAVPDDGKDDTRALRRAAEYCRTHPGTTLLFPAGVMLFCAHPVWLNFLGVAIAAVVLLIENGVHKKKNNIAEVR